MTRSCRFIRYLTLIFSMTSSHRFIRYSTFNLLKYDAMAWYLTESSVWRVWEQGREESISCT